MSILKCRENVLYRYFEIEYYEIGYFYFLGVILKNNIYEKLVLLMYINYFFYFQKRKC